MGARPLDSFDLFAPETLEDPYPFYAVLRREAPVYRPARGGFWLVSRFDDCQRVALSPDEFSSNLIAMFFAHEGGSPELVETPADAPRPVDVLAIVDEPAHARQRKLANKAFSMRRVASLEPTVRALAQELLDAIPEGRAVDWMRAFAEELPVRIVCDLIGLPQAERDRLRAWSNDGTAILSGVLSREEAARCGQSVGDLNRYLAARFAEAQCAPKDDVLGDLVRATREDAESLSHEEVVAILLQLLTAGTESTTALLGTAVRLLLEGPALEARLRAEPELVPTYVEEALRLESPFRGHFRQARRDAELGGIRIPAGTRLMVLWGSANRDERRFERPDELDLARPNPRSHLAFGTGIHHCLGAALARLEARVSLECLLERARRVRLAPGARLRHLPSVLVRRLAELPIEVAKR
jgi:cytochrome P450